MKKIIKLMIITCFLIMPVYSFSYVKVSSNKAEDYNNHLIKHNNAYLEEQNSIDQYGHEPYEGICRYVK